MSDQIEKLLRKMGAKQREQLMMIIVLIREGRVSGLDVKKLQGTVDAYRVRKGDIRVTFVMKNTNDIKIIAVERRSDTTYRDL